jgi:RecJ-like exonuclease
MAWKPGQKQVAALCEACGGPGITTEEEMAASGGKLVHDDPAICENVRRNTKDVGKCPVGQRT